LREAIADVRDAVDFIELAIGGDDNAEPETVLRAARPRPGRARLPCAYDR
jgi:hypothetical protein